MIETLNKYKLALKACNYAERTKRLYLKKFTAFLKYFSGNVAELTGAEVNEYIAAQEANPAQTIIICAAIKAYYTNCCDKTIKTLKVIRPEPEPEILTENEVFLFLNSCQTAEIKALFSIVYYLGLRRQEILNIYVSDIKGGFLTIRKTKGGDRVLKIPSHLQIIIDEYFKIWNQKYLSLTAQDRPKKLLFNFTPGEIRQLFINQMMIAGLDTPATLHSLRHSCATHLYKKGVDIIAIKNLLGHKSLNTTLIYTKYGAQGAELPELTGKEL